MKYLFLKHLQKLCVIAMPHIRSLCTPCMAIGVCALHILLVSATHAAELIPLGFLPGAEWSDASDVSDDGTVVVGSSSGGFRWTVESGMVALEDLPSGRSPRGAAGVSVDGNVVVGYAQTGRGRLESYRWTLAGGMKGLGTLKDNVANGVSADGSVVVGSGSDLSSNQAYRWTRADGRVGLGGCCDCCSGANGVSADGSVVVGRGNVGSGAFRWTSEEGMVELGDLPGGDLHSDARGVSANGKVIVGGSRSSHSALNLEAFRWTEAGGMVGLGDLPGGEFESEAVAVSADGSIVVGNSSTGSESEFFVWTQDNGMQRLEDILGADGTTGINGWSKLRAGGISDNGQWVVGRGTNPSGFREAFLAQLPDTVILGFKINPGLNDAWYNPDTSGQGFFITVFPDLGFVSMAWFTYDTELPAEDATSNLGNPGHRWLTAVGPIEGNQAIMQIEMTSGGLFDAPTEIERTDPAGSDGTITLTFDNCNSGTIDYDITSINRQGTVPIRRVADDNIVICEALSTD